MPNNTFIKLFNKQNQAKQSLS